MSRLRLLHARRPQFEEV
jgi:hypothetical protein